MSSSIPPALHNQRYISLSSFRRSGAAVATPLWFGEANGKLYFMTRSDSAKFKRIRNRSDVRVAPCTMRGRVTGQEFPATARVLPEAEWPNARKLLAQKYWLMKIPFLWSSKNAFFEVSFASCPIERKVTGSLMRL